MKLGTSLAIVLSLVRVLSAQPAAGVSLKVSEETVPAGGVAQMKVFLTEPKPIVRTGMLADYDQAFVGEFLGIAAADGLRGVADIGNGRLRVELGGALASGLDPDYPLLTVTFRMKPYVPEGATMAFGLDLGQSFWLNPAGQPYPKEAKPGAVTIGGTMYIGNVIPGGGMLMPGGAFRVIGQGFAPGMRVRAEGAVLQTVAPSEFVLTVKRRIQLTGERIVAELPNKERQTYFSYLRGTVRARTMNPALETLHPVFPTGAATAELAPLRPSSAMVEAVGIQNPADTAAEVKLEVINVLGQPLMTADVTLASREAMFLSAEEIFGAALPPQAFALVARSAGPFQLTIAEVSTTGPEIRVPAVVTLRGASF